MGTVPLNPCPECGEHMNGLAYHRCPEVVLVCGSRDWTDRDAIRQRLLELPKGSVVIAGGARGADKIAAELARSLGLHAAVVMPFWDRYGGAAGRVRNLAMLMLLGLSKRRYVIAFNLGTPGTAHTIESARSRGIHVEEWSPETVEQTEVRRA